ncbi:MAG: hypothetical protein O3B19_03285 [Actinomycetota bacterium]|nr:hypothetical protein [Actinomycetota bacterium]MDA2971176.1 hypothetical protein [Actinomycetota bacterium]
MRQTCERIGCGRDVAVVYGTAPGRDGSLTLWIDAFRADVSGSREREIMGFVCREHGERLSPPRGWLIDDRRENSPRLFKPQPNLQVVRDRPARSRKEKVGALPRPSLFAETAPESEVVSAPVVAPISEAAPSIAPDVVSGSVDSPIVEIAEHPEVVVEPDDVLVEPDDVPHDPDPTGDSTGSWEPFFDPDDDLDGQLNATGSMLRDAFRSRHNGRRNV